MRPGSGSDGYLYGVSQVGGKDNAGTIFRVSLAERLKSFTPSQGNGRRLTDGPAR